MKEFDNLKHGIMALMLTLTMVMSIPLATVADIEDNGSFESSETIPVPAIVSGTLDKTDQDDIYRAEVLKGQTLFVSVFPNETLGLNLYLYLREGSGSGATYTEVASDRAPTIGVSQGVPRSLNYTTNSLSDTYWLYFWVGVYEGTGSYELHISLISQDDAGTDTDAGDSFESPTAIGAGSYTGFMANADDVDIYKIDLVKGDSIYVDVQPDAELSLNVYLIRVEDKDGLPDYVEVDRDKRAGDEGHGEHRHVEYSLDSQENSTTMLVRLYRDQDMGNYSMKSHIDHQNDGKSGTDAPDTDTSPYELPSAGWYPGTLKGLDELDHYQVVLGDRESLHVNVTPDPAMSVAIHLYVDGTEVSIDKAKHPEVDTGVKRSVNYTMPRTKFSKIAVLKVVLDHASGNYTVEVKIEPKPVDHDPPIVVMVDPAPNSAVKKIRTIPFSGTATDYNEVSRIEMSMDELTWTNATISGDEGEYVWNITMRFYKRGNNTIYLRAQDDQGNEGITTFTVNYKHKQETPGFEAFSMVVALAIGLVLFGRSHRRG